MAARRRLLQGPDGWCSYASNKPARTPRRRPASISKSQPRRRPISRLFPIPQPLTLLLPPLDSPQQPPTSSPSSSSLPPELTMPTGRDVALAWYAMDAPTKKAYATDPFLLGKHKLDVPPHPNKPGWQDRFFKCLVRGHDASDCRAPRQQASLSAQLPKGSISDAALPQDRPSVIDVYLPQSADAIDDLRYLSKGVVIDARLRSGAFCSARVQAAVLTFTNSTTPLPLLHMAADRFLILLGEGADRSAFISSIKAKMESFGLVLYAWSPAINATPIGYRYKLWIDLLNVTVNAWNLRHVLPLVGQFGLLLDNTPFSEVSSIEKLRVLVVVRCLSDVPKLARLIVRGLRHEIPVQVVAGIEERLELATTPADPTPSFSYFRDLELKLQANPPSSHGFNRQQAKVASVTLGFEVAFEAWLAMPASSQKDELGRRLQDSPYWAITKTQAYLGRVPVPPAILAEPPPLPLQPISAKQSLSSIVVHTGSETERFAIEN